MRVQHNIMAMSAYRNYTNNVSAMKKNLEKLSSGYKINRAGDDAAGLAISEKMRAQITGLQTAQKNAKDGISLVQTAEGALTEVHDMLNRMVELATQSANGTYDNTTDRNQMQKEINQLLSEIDRIADSSNFNGINLLDGTLGLNTDAFTVGGVAKAVDLIAGEEIDGAASAAASDASTTHVSDSTPSQDPSFAIDVADWSLTTGTVTGGEAVAATVTIGTTTVNISLAKSGNASNKVYTATDIASAIVAAFNTGKNAGGTANSAGSINGLMFHASFDGGKITFTYEGVSDNGTAVASDKALGDATTTGGTKTYASEFNKFFGTEFKIETDGKEVSSSGRYDCKIVEPQEAIAAGSKQRAGITFTLGSKVIGDGNVLTIDGKDFIIKTAASNSVVASDAENVIDISGYATAATATKLRQIVIQLANSTTANFTIHSEDADAGKIHLEQKVSAYGTEASKQYDYAKLEKLISARGADTAGKAAGTVLDVTAANVKEGNVLKIGEGTNAVEVKFGASDTTATAVQAKIAAALGTKYTVELATGTAAATASGVSRFIIRGADTKAAAGPRILGKGLTLQIGDTADSFNQLNVAVQDMHAESIGVGKLDISTEEAAQTAVDKIKAAINTVSDVRGTLGATQNRLDHTINNLSVMTENIQDAESTIRDTDIAEEMMAYTKNNILIQSAQAMLAQANQVPQGVLQLLG